MSKTKDKKQATEAETPDSLLNADAGAAAELTEGQLDKVAGAFLKTPFKYNVTGGG